MQCLHPGAEALLKRLRIEPVEDTLERGMRRNTVGQSQESLQPVHTAASKLSDLLPIVATTDDAAKGDRDNIQEPMQPTSISAWILELAEILLDGDMRLSHESPPWTRIALGGGG